MKFYTTERIGPKRSFTPEGFLLCADVPIARVGTMLYHESELPLDALDGVIRVERIDEEVFKPEAIASFAGKPVVNDHPQGDVTPVNWRDLSIGTVLNPRRGEGNMADVMIADLLITDAAGIAAIEDGKIEVSCGYDAEYEQIKPGFARQLSIIGNHVALVAEGRCGPRCSIGDQSMSTTLKKAEGQMAAKTKSFKDRLMAAFRSKDEAAIEKLANEVTEDGEIAEPDVKGTSAAGITINVHGNSGASAPAKTGDEEEPEVQQAENEALSKLATAVDAIGKTVEGLVSRMDAYEKTGTGDADPDDEDDGDKTADAEGEGEEEDKDKTKTGDRRTVRDSAGLATAFQDTIARAEILSPGIKVPTFDAKLPARKTQDALCAFRRKVIDRAYATDDGKAAIDAVLAGDKLDTKSMTCDAARILFNAASERVKAANTAATVGVGRINSKDTGAVKVGSIADMNKAARDFWKR